MDKHLTPNIVAALVLLLGLLVPEPAGTILRSIGLFALSGALTNWLAVHMLFERVPGLYGSGVIVLHFEEFKAGILRLVHEELFSREKVEELLSGATRSASSPTSATSREIDSAAGTPGEIDSPDTDQFKGANTQPGAASEPTGKPFGSGIDLEPLIGRIDLDVAFNQLVSTISESSFGNMLAMVGGAEALEPLRDPFKRRMYRFLLDAARSPRMQAIIAEQVGSAANTKAFTEQLDRLIRARLDELTPERVRDIMQRMIRKHLGWLVVWGGVFGGLIGLVAGVVSL